MKLVVRARTLTKRVTLTATAFVLALSGAVSAVPYFVSTQANAVEGDPACVQGRDCYATIQSAVDAAMPNDTINIAMGTYNESVTINKALTIKGAQAGKDARTRTIDSTSETIVNGGDKTVFTIGASNVTLDGLQIEQVKAGSEAISTPTNYNDITIVNNIVTRTGPRGSAARLYGGTNFVIKNNYFSNIAGQGIILRNGNKANPVASNQKIIDNKIDNIRAMNGGAIVIYGQSDTEIARNDITTTFQGISVGAVGESYYDMHTINVHNNTVKLVLDGSQPNVYKYGLIVEGRSDGVLVNNNTIEQSGVAPTNDARYSLIRISYDDVPTSSANPTGLKITQNNLVSNVSDRYIVVGSNITNPIDATNNWWGSVDSPKTKVGSNVNVAYDSWLCGTWEANLGASIDGSCVVTPDIPAFTYTTTPSNTVKTSGDYTAEGNFKFNLSSSDSTVRYQLKYWNDIAGSRFKQNSPWNPTDTSWSGHMTSLGVYEDNFTQGEGKHYFSFSACNASGKCSDYSESFIITYDKTKPVIYLDKSAVKGYYKQGETAGMHVSDANYKETRIYKLDDGEFVYSGKTYTDAWFGLGWLKDNTYKVVSEDKAGNTAEEIFTIDKVNPNVVGTADPSINPKEFTIATTDAAISSGIARTVGNIYKYDKDNGKAGKDGYYLYKSNTNASENLKITSLSSLPDGTYYVRYNASDKAGNISATKTFNFTVDSKAPTVTVNPLALPTDTRPQITGTVEDLGTGVKGVVVRILSSNGDVVDESNIDNPVARVDGTWSWTPAVALTQGTSYAVVAYAEDNANNASSTDTTTAQPYWTTLRVRAAGSSNSGTDTNSGANQSQQTRQLALTPAPLIAFTPLGTAAGNQVANNATTGTGTTGTTGTEAVKGATDTKTVNASDSDSDKAVLGDTDEKTWSLVNAAIAVVMTIAGIVTLVGAFRKKEGNKRVTVRVFAAVLAAAAILVFFVVEHIPSSMIWANNWTLLFAVLAVAQIIVLSQTKKEDE